MAETMRITMERAINDGIFIQNMENKNFYECRVCNIKEICGMQSGVSHLAGGQHLKKLKSFSNMNSLTRASSPILSEIANTSFSNMNSSTGTGSLPRASPTLSEIANTSSAVVADGIAKGILVPGINCSFTCNICKIFISGEGNVNSHLNGKSHLTRMAAGFTSSSPTAASASISSLSLCTPCPTTSSLSSTKSDVSIVEESIKSGVLEEKGFNVLLCKPCNLSVTGHVPAKDHLLGGTHRKRTNSLFTQTSLFGSIASEIASSPTRNYSMVSSTSGSTYCSIVQENINSNVLEDRGNNELYCKFCNASMTGSIPAEAHLQGGSHRSKANLWRL